MAAILASAITALDGSEMRPVTEAFVDWPRRAGVNPTRMSNAKAGTRCTVNLQEDADLATLRSACQMVNPQRGVVIYPQIWVMLVIPSCEINESKMWMPWEQPTGGVRWRLAWCWRGALVRGRWIRHWTSVNTRTRRGRSARALRKARSSQLPRRPTVTSGWARNSGCFTSRALRSKKAVFRAQPEVTVGRLGN